MFTLIELFLETSKDLIENIRTAIISKDLKRLSDAAHSLKSSAATLGAIRLSEVCNQLESVGDGNLSIEHLNLFSQNFEDELVEANQALKELVFRAH